MKVYHGSISIIEKPNLEVLNYKTSSEKKFCTSIDKDTAEYWAEEKSRKILEKNKSVILKKYINVYEFVENEKLNILDFNKLDEPDKFIEKNKSNEILHNYDIIKGPKINERLVEFLKEYKQRKLKKEELIDMLIIYKTINEISFHTEEAIKTLKFLCAEEIK